MTKQQPKPPTDLCDESKALWRDLCREYDFSSDHAGLALLNNLCKSISRLRECEAAIQRDGLTVEGSQGQQRPHPLLATENEIKRIILGHYRALKLAPPDDI